MEPFGSFLSNLYTRWGDLDISIELPNGAYISSAGKKHKQTLLGHVLNALRSKGNLLWIHAFSFFLLFPCLFCTMIVMVRTLSNHSSTIIV